jgi:hypothetical protein
MSKPRPWWETYPRKYWTIDDRRAAHKAGVVVPPLPPPDVDPAIALIAATTPKLASLPGGLDGDPNHARDVARRRRVDALLEKHGIQPRQRAR